MTDEEEFDSSLRIRRAFNGFILEGMFGEFVVRKEFVIEEKNDYSDCDDSCSGGELDCMKRMLEEVMDYFGFHHDKFAEKNLKIIYEKGHKYIESGDKK